MQVEPSQLIPGCILQKDVVGKTQYPIIPQQTILTEDHIVILDKFLIDAVDVAAKLENGERFIPQAVDRQDREQSEVSSPQELEPEAHFNVVMGAYRKMFRFWRNGTQLDIEKIRKLLNPLLERLHDIAGENVVLAGNGNKRDYFYHHSIAIAVLAAYTAKKMGFTRKEYMQVGLSAFLSDCGAVKLSTELMTKEEPLEQAEKNEIKKHPVYSYRMLENETSLTHSMKLAVLQHHENLDGSGYPLGLTEENIHVYAQIIAVCDQYDALTSGQWRDDRKSPFEAMKDLQEAQPKNLSFKAVSAFNKKIAQLLIGKNVKLSDGRLGEVIFFHINNPAYPMVRLIDGGDIIALDRTPGIYIKEMV